MQIKLDLSDLKLGQLIFKEEKKVVFQAAKRAITRAIASTQKEAVSEIRKHLKMRPTEIKGKYLSSWGARGSNLDALIGRLTFSGKSISMIHFAVGPKQPKAQAGIAVAARKPLKVEITPGKRRATKLFILNTRSGVHVFARGKGHTKSGSGLVRKQSVMSLAHLVQNNNGDIIDKLKSHASERIAIEYEREHSYALEQLKNKLGRG
jgi:hypothetical protein